MRDLSPPTRSNDRLSWTLGAALIVWMALAAAGWYGISAHGFNGAATSTADVAMQWPAESTIERMTGRPTLVLFLHPMCPCSRATLAELERLPVLAPNEALPEVCIVAAAPRSVGELWWSSSNLARAARLPNAHVFRDPGGVVTALFNARVSGSVLLFDATGRRLYAGGVTMARGHAGDNVGLQAITRLLRDHQAKVVAIPAWGCELVREASLPAAARSDTADADHLPREERAFAGFRAVRSRSSGADPI